MWSQNVCCPTASWPPCWLWSPLCLLISRSKSCPRSLKRSLLPKSCSRWANPSNRPPPPLWSSSTCRRKVMQMQPPFKHAFHFTALAGLQHSAYTYSYYNMHQTPSLNTWFITWFQCETSCMTHATAGWCRGKCCTPELTYQSQWCRMDYFYMIAMIACAKMNESFLNSHYLSSAADKAYMDALKENQKFSVSRCYLVSLSPFMRWVVHTPLVARHFHSPLTAG